MSTVTQEYLAGIREGRETMAILKANDVPDARQELANVEHFIRKVAPAYGSAAGMDFLRGERDFWRNQCEKVAHS